MSPSDDPPADPPGADFPAGAPLDFADDVTLGPATRLLWRSDEVAHFELGSRGAVVSGLGREVIASVATRSPDPGGAPQLTGAEREILSRLVSDGYLWPRAGSLGRTPPPGHSEQPGRTPPVPRLARELTALSARHGRHASAVLDRRRRASVVVFGNGGAGVHLAAVLAAAGVGRVRCSVAGSTRLGHAVPGGVDVGDEGRDLAAAADEAIHRAAPEVDTTPLTHGDRPDLTVLALDTPIDDDRRAALHAARAAHLVMSLGVDHGVVGPLVLPGLTSCLRCADLHRLDRDPGWPALAVQLSIPPRLGQAVDLAVAAVVVGTAAAQALLFLDGGQPACIEASIELHLPDWRLRRRRRTPHPDCECLPDEPVIDRPGRTGGT